MLVTGYDIIFFWVARMIFSGMEQMKQEPFKTVFIHGLVRDDKGRKMSKSLGNGIDPLEMADKFGADALRFNLITGNSPGNDMRFFVEKCEAMRNFANKIWNAARYVMMNLTIDHVQLPEQLELEDKWVLSKLNTLIREVTDNMEAYELGVASAKIYDFIWDTYCDWYIELTKARLYGEDEEAKLAAQNVLCYVLLRVLELLHPFMPFITEEIWQALPHEGDFLIRAQWPEYQERFAFTQEENAMEAVKDAISAVRARRSEMNVPPSRKAKILIVTQTPDIYAGGRDFIMPAGLRQRGGGSGAVSGGSEGYGHRGHPQRHPLSASGGVGGHPAGVGAHRQGENQGRGESGPHREEAAKRELRVQGPGGRGQCRAGEG